jgi:hypothetical protein
MALLLLGGLLENGLSLRFPGLGIDPKKNPAQPQAANRREAADERHAGRISVL